ncbi:hypothetical protein EP073_04495 [Geovibrio thiophilus]|uniref:Uncharacterized protein n=1 Tax=Geovibrio thiophilus TaxID=139438 RepID=A0A410JWW4_9BACT|nr:hypothetical protein [Geovibrio thiophilus]QAR32692.1 hypothetical protein EP073_04495 [Geovibrio thiophilus]
MNNLTDREINEAKKRTKYIYPDNISHEHNDCIKIAYEWLDAQKKNKSQTTKRFMLKHYIQEWSGKYISTSDVEVAATLHPEINGQYPFYNISSRLTEPSVSRLENIGEPEHSNTNRNKHKSEIYKLHE